ncbi:MAG: hypothetical protein OEW08_13830 [Gammaproteobacteria bacterium]|nr:hypothetical protein [Gammaproteobacteria bacterium]
MAIVASELIQRGSASRPEDDASTSGGAIDNNCILDVTQLAANAKLEVVSSNAADTMNLTIAGRDASGAIVTETRALTGTTVLQFATNTLERFLKASLAATPAGNVTIRVTGAGATVVVIPAGATSAAILFINASSEAAQTVRYEKVFWKNTNATLTLTAAQITLTADPSAIIRIAVAAAKNDAVSVANRKTAPGGVTFVDDGVAVNVPGNQLEAAASIGGWIEMTRAAAAGGLKTTYTTQLAGTTV